MKKVFLEELPHKYGIGANLKTLVIDWQNSIGYNVKFIYNDIKGCVEIIGYSEKYLTIIYNNENFTINIDSFKRCNLGSIIGVNTSEFKIEIGTIFKDDKRDITITARKKIRDEKTGQLKKYYKYYCNKCTFDCGEHWSIKNKQYKKEHWIVEANLLRGVGCSICCSNTTIVVENINSIYSTNKWMIPIINDDEFCKTHTHISNDAIFPVCPICGQVKNKKIKICDIYRTHSVGCSCNDSISYPNKFAYELLRQLNEIYKFDYLEYEYSPDWIKPKRYDNYFKLNGKEYILEMDGGLGHGKKQYNKNSKTKEETLDTDNYKDRLAQEHGIEVIRIDCDKSNLCYIKTNILKSKLNELFELKKIDWNECDISAFSNLVKIVCEYRSNNMKVKEISLKMNLSIPTVCKYSKLGSTYGWYKYKIKVTKDNTIKHNKKSKPVEIFKDGVSLGIFKSTMELERQSEKLFRVKLLNNGISKVCIGKSTQYKGYTFKYVEEDMKEVANF